MKKYLLILFVPLAFWACNKTTDPVPSEPELATALVGTYNASYNRVDTIGVRSTAVMLVSEDALPFTYNGATYSAAFVIRRDSASVIYVTFNEKITGTQTGSASSVVGQLKIRGTSAPYDLLSTSSTKLPVGDSRPITPIVGTKVGTSDGTNFNMDYTLPFQSGAKYHEVYTARK